MRYLDTSLLISAFTNEPDTDVALDLIAENGGHDLAISDWSIVEFASAISLKVRRNDLTRTQADEAVARFRSLGREALRVLPVEHRDFQRAARMADAHATGLRSGDALHLAVAESHEATMCTRDKILARAGPHFGVRARLIGS